MKRFLFLLMVSAVATFSFGAETPAAQPLLLEPAQVWTAGEPLHSGWVVLIEGKQIKAVGPRSSVTVPPDVEHIALPGMTVLPGLMDLHSHLLLHPYSEKLWDAQVLTEPPAYRTVVATKHAEATLMAGFTTLRDLGTEGAGFADVGLKRAINEGVIPGPRLWVVTRAIVATGAYGPAVRNYRPDIALPQGAQEATGEAEAVAAVREQAARGADWIKIYGDYRTGPHGETRPTFTQAEMNAMVAAAHDSGRPVAVHAESDEGMRRAVLAGVDTIEHGTGGSEATFRLMAERHVAYMPTLTAVEAYGIYFQHYVPGNTPTEDMREVAHAFELARKAGVTIGCGSDVGVFAHGENWRELAWMVRDGMLQTSRSLGLHTVLQPYASTALGASEVSLLELANAYRTMASGIFAEPHVIQRILGESGKVVLDNEDGWPQINVDDNALALIQEGLRGVVRLPSGTAHALDSRGFPVAVMGKTGTTNDFRDALFVGSTYGSDGITVAVRVGFDDNRSLGRQETGGRVALPVFKEIMLKAYSEQLVGSAPEFPPEIERSITSYLNPGSVEPAVAAEASLATLDVRSR